MKNLGLYTHYEEWEENPIYLPSGEMLLKSLIDKWREMHTEMQFQFLHSFSGDPKKMHALVFKKEKCLPICRFASFGPGSSDLASIFCKKSALKDEIISSLHFLDQTIKIFGFDAKVYLVGERDVYFHEALKQLNFSFQEEKEGEISRVEFRLVDKKKKMHKGPYVAVEDYSDEIGLIHRSLFGSIERWIAFLLEKQLKGS